MADDISLIVGVDYSELTGLVKTTTQTKAALGSIAKEFANSGSQKAYMAGINKLVVAQNKLDKSARMSRSEIMKLGAQMKQEAQFANALTRATTGLGGSLQQAGRRTNQLGVLMQQTGYQVGDFAVQVQSGTNVMVALGQQATQLVGTFGMLAKSTKMIGLFAGLGIAIPIITGIAGAIMRTSEDAEAAEPKVESFKDIVQELSDKAKASTQELRLFHSALKTIEQLKTTDKIAEIREEIANLDKSAEEVIRGFVEGMGGGEAQIAAALANIDSPEFQKVLDSAKRVKEEKIATLNAELERQVAAEKLLDIENSYRELMGELKDEAAEQAQLRRESIADAAIELSAMSDKLLLLQIEAGLGKDSVAYREELLRQEQSRIIALLEQGKITEKQAEDYLRLFEETQKVTDEIDNSADSAKNLADALKEAASAMSNLSSFGQGLDKAIAVAAAKVKALKEGANEAVAGRIAGLRADLEVKLSAKGLKPEAATGLRSEFGSKISTLESLLSEGAALKPSGGSKKAPKDPLVELNKRITLDEKLLGVSKERETVLRAIANSDKEYTDAAINGAISRLEAYNKEKELLEEAAAQQQNIADTLKNSMEDAFMSIVDGTKSAEDAFKDMARMIISELYKVLVVQQMVGSFEAGGGGILGSIFGAIGKKASGGTVMSNQPYLVGEKGPEVIVPQNRGHVMNADLTAKAMGGSGEAVVVNQTFNFAANGDDSVKKLIAQAAPQIANMTQKQIMDSRRRGGAMKSTFG